MRLNVFGRQVEVVRNKDAWQAYYLGNEGKRRPAKDIVIPSNLKESDLVNYISDLCHEWAHSGNTEVLLIE